jgi:Icc-related predicted phosphoesterase
VRRAGCPHLLERIQEIEPRLVVFGHIHEGRGEWRNGRTTLANVTLLNASYQACFEPWVFDLRTNGIAV